ncbi:hypothetical protein HOLleu_28086 [Holothuria leucospilota]|uniref:Uncharacterized protein n=1 Tax=Holothuria leucospilota TaxID=206669 RepID=A0A9Q1BLE2_HOLLE|nr:hypothetical protein HOLleu_28086 [Holothuria leucospilota]
MSFTLPDFQGPTGAHRTPRQARRFPEQQGATSTGPRREPTVTVASRSERNFPRAQDRLTHVQLLFTLKPSPQLGPPGSRWSICYCHQDLHPRRLHAGSRPDRFKAHTGVLPTRREHARRKANSSPDGPARPPRSAPFIFRAS